MKQEAGTEASVGNAYAGGLEALEKLAATVQDHEDELANNVQDSQDEEWTTSVEDYKVERPVIFRGYGPSGDHYQRRFWNQYH